MKVLHIIGNLNMGGAEKILTDMLPNMSQNEIDVDLTLLKGGDTVLIKKMMEFTKIDIRILSCKSVYNPWLIFKIIPLLKHYEIVHVHLFPALYWVALAKLISFSRVRLIFTEHSTGNRRLHSKFFNLFDRIVYRVYNKIICITPEVKNVLISKLKISSEKLKVILNGVNIEEIDISIPKSRYDLGYTSESILLIMVGAFRHEKDQDTIIKAMVDLPYHYKLILVGDGARRSLLESLIKINNLEDRVSLLGVRDDVYSLMKMCDVAILSSHWEGFGLSAVESMACGVPTIASNVPGLAEVVSGGGLLFEKGNSESLIENLLLLEESKFYSSVKEKGKIRAQSFDINYMVEQTIELYNEEIQDVYNN